MGGVIDLNGAGIGAVIVLIELLIIMALIGMAEIRGRFEK